MPPKMSETQKEAWRLAMKTLHEFAEKIKKNK
jgi:hypothetical protein